MQRDEYPTFDRKIENANIRILKRIMKLDKIYYFMFDFCVLVLIVNVMYLRSGNTNISTA